MNNTSEIIPTRYESWRHCITVECGIPLTHTFINERIAVFTDPNNLESARFRKLYGDKHWQNIIQWYRLAQTELGVA